jgi:membrane glycosyltransferase
VGRRAFVLTGTAILTAAGCYEMYRVLQGRRSSRSWNRSSWAVRAAVRMDRFLLHVGACGLCVLLFRRKGRTRIDSAAPLPAICSRTAMLLPTYNEDPYRVLARLRAIYESVKETGNDTNFDWFILS